MSHSEYVFTGSNFSMVYANIKKCGLYQDNCREWSQKPRLKKTWIKSKAHFAQAFMETRRSSRTSKNEGYAVNVHAAQANAVIFTKIQQEHTLAMENLATATQSNRTSVALLMKTISELSSQVTTLNVKPATSQSNNACMKKSVHCSAPAEHGHRASSNTIP